nr:MAG TPA: hypothetical protein [Bacteriophage sp.]
MTIKDARTARTAIVMKKHFAKRTINSVIAICVI